MEYSLLAQSDEQLIEAAALPREGIAVAIRSTGYDYGSDEVLEMAIVDLSGKELFHKVVRPQEVTDWEPSDATGGISPSDVADLDMDYLSDFETEVSDFFENAPIVVGAHLPYIEAMIDQSWVTLPEYQGFDVVERFRESHASSDRRNEPAAVATLDGVAAYYGLDFAGTGEEGVGDGKLVASAQAVAAAYNALVGEVVREYDAKGEAYWQAYEKRKAEEEARALLNDPARQARERNINRMNGAMWLFGGIIFAAVAIQAYQRGLNVGIVVVCAVACIFSLVNAVRNIFK